VYAGAGVAWRDLLAVRFVAHGSDQRPDWIANALLLAPLGYLAMASLQFRGARPWMRGAFSFLLGLLFIVVIKYLQLFFPPRTVTLNYIVAQSLGLAFGIVLFRLSQTRLAPVAARHFRDGEGLTILLGFYTIWLLAYLLAPFDFALDPGDLSMRVEQLRGTLLDLPGDGRGAGFRALLILGDTLALAPVGMLLAVLDRSRSIGAQLLRGFTLILAVEVLSLFVLNAAVYPAALAYRMVGVWLGLVFMRRLRGKDLRKRHYAFSRYVPAALGLYTLILMFANGLMTRQWVSWDQAVNALEMRQFLPFWNLYIVTKSHAIQSLTIHGLVYAPIGVMIWVRRGFWARGGVFSAVVALLLSLTMELGRWMKPGLRPDFTDPLIAAAAAAIAFKAMPMLWRMFEREARMAYLPKREIGAEALSASAAPSR
jgi:glycopeptide antibiotics resistance protein